MNDSSHPQTGTFPKYTHFANSVIKHFVFNSRSLSYNLSTVSFTVYLLITVQINAFTDNLWPCSIQSIVQFDISSRKDAEYPLDTWEWALSLLQGLFIRNTVCIYLCQEIELLTVLQHKKETRHQNEWTSDQIQWTNLQTLRHCAHLFSVFRKWRAVFTPRKTPGKYRAF